MARARKAQAGFTLIELVLTTAIGGIIATTIFGTMLVQQQSYMQQLAYAEAQQNARAALAIVQYYVRQAGWGFARGTTDGVVPIGSCGDNSVTCNGVDSGSDRIQPISATATSADGLSQGKFPGDSALRYALKKDADNNVLPDPGGLPNGTRVILSGVCKTPSGMEGRVETAILTIKEDKNDGQYYHKYDFVESPNCHYGDIFIGFGAVTAAELYIDKTSDAAHPRLMLDPDAGGDLEPLVVAYDIEDLQVQYGVDTNATADNIVDVWCDQLDTTTCVGGMSTATDNQRRVIAARVAIVARTRNALPNYQSTALTVFGHYIAGGDGYRRWVYRTTLALRSINL